jgi:hypothetical protein
VVSRGLATLHELQEVYGLEDLYKLVEVLAVDASNQQVLNKSRVKKR